MYFITNFLFKLHQNLTKYVIPLSVETEDPEFTDVIDNITVPAGRNIKLACSVKNLGSYKVRILINTYINERNIICS